MIVLHLLLTDDALDAINTNELRYLAWNIDAIREAERHPAVQALLNPDRDELRN